MNKRVLLIVFILIAALAGGLWIARRGGAGGKTASGQKAKKDIYQCSMHPQIVSDKPGDCPICHMRLSKVEQTSAQEEAAQNPGTPKERKILFYRHPMNPSVTSPAPAKDEMGMDYIPVYEDEAAGAAESTIPGHAAFNLSPERQQMIGVRTTRAERKPLHLEIRSVGRVAYDPELYNALSEYREAAAAKEKLPDTAAPEARERIEALVRAAALRLRVMGITEAQLPQMINEASDSTNLLLPGKNVWVYAQVYENEADLVRSGQSVVITMPSSRDRSYRGEIASVDPVLDPATRTLRVRIKVETPQERLKPESFVHAKIQVPLGRVLSVPEDAVLDTGENQIVFVKKGQGEFEPRAVKIGREAQGQYEIISGLEEGEEVVTSANFLIDSESRFRSAVSSFSGKGSPEGSNAPAGHSH